VCSKIVTKYNKFSLLLHKYEATALFGFFYHQQAASVVLLLVFAVNVLEIATYMIYTGEIPPQLEEMLCAREISR